MLGPRYRLIVAHRPIRVCAIILALGAKVTRACDLSIPNDIP